MVHATCALTEENLGARPNRWRQIAQKKVALALPVVALKPNDIPDAVPETLRFLIFSRNFGCFVCANHEKASTQDNPALSPALPPSQPWTPQVLLVLVVDTPAAGLSIVDRCKGRKCSYRQEN